MKRSWANWMITEAPDRPIPDCPNGTLEQRAFITCPECGDKINVTSVNAMRNRSITARTHMKTCKSLAASTLVVPATAACPPTKLPPSKRPRTEEFGELKQQLAAMQQQMQQQMQQMQQQQQQDKNDILFAIAQAIGFHPPFPDTRDQLVDGIKVKMLKYDNMEKQLTCAACMELPVNAMIRPCNHASLCIPCFEKYKSHSSSRVNGVAGTLACPICKTGAEDVWPVHLGSSM